MSDVDIHFMLFLSNDINRDKVKKLCENIIYHYPMSMSDCAKNDYIEEIFDFDKFHNKCDNYCSFLLFDKYNVKIWGEISNWERDTSFQRIHFDGRRQAHGSIHSDGKPGPVGLFQEFPSTGHMAVPFFSLSAKVLDAYFGIAGHMLDFALYDKQIFTSPSFELINIIDDCVASDYVHPEIYDLFEQERVALSKSARIENIETSLRSARWRIIDGYKQYTIEVDDKKELLRVRQIRTPETLHDYEYIEELIGQYWSTFYYDKALVESIGFDTLKSISTRLEWVGDKGVFIDCEDIPFGLGTESRMDSTIYNERILPSILERMHKEYSMIGLY